MSDRFWPRPTELPRDLGAGVTIALVSIAEGMAVRSGRGREPRVRPVRRVGQRDRRQPASVLDAADRDRHQRAGAGCRRPDRRRLGLARLGSVVQFISAEIQAGLVAAVALLIVLGQYDELVGYPSTTTVAGGGKVVKAFDISLHLPSWDGPTAAVGGLCIVALLIAKRSRLRPFADIVAMVLGVAVVAGLGLDSVETVGDIATIPTRLDAIPTPHLPDLSLVPALIPAAIAAAIVGLAEAATVGAAYPNPSGARSE